MLLENFLDLIADTLIKNIDVLSGANDSDGNPVQINKEF